MVQIFLLAQLLTHFRKKLVARHYDLRYAGRMRPIAVPLATCVLLSALFGENSTAQSHRNVVAVFPVIGKGLRISTNLREALTAYVATEIAENPKYRVVPSTRLDEVLAELKHIGFTEGYDAKTRVEIGNKVAATTGAITQIIKLGPICKVSIKFYDLKSNVSSLARGKEGQCDEAALAFSIRAVLKEFHGSTLIRRGPLRVGIQPWGGYIGGLYANQGLKTAPGSLYAKAGVEVEFKQLNSVAASVDAWKNNEIDVTWITVDSLPTEYEQIRAGDPVVVLLAAWSRGEEVMVVRPEINNLNDLDGKTIILEEDTTS